MIRFVNNTKIVGADKHITIIDGEGGYQTRLYKDDVLEIISMVLIWKFVTFEDIGQTMDRLLEGKEIK